MDEKRFYKLYYDLTFIKIIHLNLHKQRQKRVYLTKTSACYTVRLQ